MSKPTEERVGISGTRPIAHSWRISMLQSFFPRSAKRRRNILASLLGPAPFHVMECGWKRNQGSTAKPLDVRIAGVAAAMVWVCLAISKVVSYVSALMRWLQASFYLLVDSVLRNWLCLVESVPNSSLEGNRRSLSLLQKMLGEILPVLSSLVDQSMIQCWVHSGSPTPLIHVQGIS